MKKRASTPRVTHKHSSRLMAQKPRVADEHSPRHRLARCRLMLGLTPAQMAEQMGMLWDTYRRYEAPLGTSYASTPTLRAAVAIRDMSAELHDEIDPGDWIEEQDEQDERPKSWRRK